MPTPTTKEIRNKALQIYFSKNPQFSISENIPEDSELREEGMWQDARNELMGVGNRDKDLQEEETQEVTPEEEAREIELLKAYQENINKQIDEEIAKEKQEHPQLTDNEAEQIAIQHFDLARMSGGPPAPPRSTEAATSPPTGPAATTGPNTIGKPQKEEAPTTEQGKIKLTDHKEKKGNEKMSATKPPRHIKTPPKSPAGGSPTGLKLWFYDAILAEIKGGSSSMLLAFAGSQHLNDFLHQAGLISDDAWNAVKGMSTLFSETANVVAIAQGIGSVLTTLVEGAASIENTNTQQAGQTRRVELDKLTQLASLAATAGA